MCFTFRTRLMVLLVHATCFLCANSSLDSLKTKAAQLRDTLGKIKCYQAISDHYIESDQLDSAIVYLNKARGLCKTKGTDKSKAQVNCNLGIVYKELGFFDEGLAHYIRALSYFEAQEDHKSAASVKINIGQLYNAMQQYKQALSVMRESIGLLNKIRPVRGNSAELAFAYNNLAIAFQNLNQTDSALHYYLKSLAIKQNLKNYLSASFTLNNLGTLYIEKDPARALSYFFESMALKRKLKSMGGLINCYTNIGQIYERKGDAALALRYQDSAMALLATYNNPDLRSSVLYNLSAAYKKNNNYPQALKYLKEYTTLTDSINGQAVAQKIATLQFMYEHEKKEKEIQLSKASINLLEKEIVIKNNRVFILIAIAVGLVLLLLLLGMSLRFKQKRFTHSQALLLKEKQIQEIENQHLKQEVEHKNRELSLLTLHSLHKKELMLQLKDKIAANDAKAAPDPQTKKLNSLIEDILNFEGDWKIFKEHFEQTNMNFFKHLEQLSQELTQIDLRHCAYIKIGLTTKEISELLNIAPESVQKSRLRLKKKLGLDRDTDLRTYVKNIQ